MAKKSTIKKFVSKPNQKTKKNKKTKRAKSEKPPTSIREYGIKGKSKTDPRAKPKKRVSKIHTFDVETLDGIAPLAQAELRRLANTTITRRTSSAVRITTTVGIPALRYLRRCVAVYHVSHYDVPRPKALLGDQIYRELVENISYVIENSRDKFKTFRIEAAGKDSAVFQRLAQDLSKSLKLRFDENDGELMLRFKPIHTKENVSWEVQARTTARPISAREWRVCNMSGGLNASFAVVMNDLAKVGPHSHYLNAMSGSGTLLIEQAQTGYPASLTGIDLNPDAINCAEKNIKAANLKNVTLLQEDATHTSLPSNHFDVITSDLPWGDAIGSGHTNQTLYPAFLTEMARVATLKARLLVLTHDIRRFESVLAKNEHWRVTDSLQAAHSGHNPKLYVLRRKT